MLVCLLDAGLRYSSACHDSDYLDSLRSLTSESYRQKVLLLLEYSNLAQGFENLGLKTLHIPGLFLTKRSSFKATSLPLHTRAVSESVHSRTPSNGYSSCDGPDSNIWSTNMLLSSGGTMSSSPMSQASTRISMSSSSSNYNNTGPTPSGLSPPVKNGIKPLPGVPLSKREPTATMFRATKFE